MSMTNEQKNNLVTAASEYLKRHGLSQNEFARIVGINTSYLSNIMKGVFTFRNSRTGADSDIDVKWFNAIAEKIGFAITKEYWPLVETEQFLDIAKELTEAKETLTTRIIIGETGCGKTYTVNRFSKAYPLGTYIITCNKNDRITDIVRKIQRELNINLEGSVSARIDRISMELSREFDNGNKPMLIFDESEYLSVTGLLSIKTIYDYLKGTCSIILIGTSDLLNKLEHNLKKEGAPQFYSRFRVGIRYIRPIDKSFSRFFSRKNFDKELRDLICRNASDYRGLADYLEPAIKEADKRGVPLTIDLFNSMFYLQNR